MIRIYKKTTELQPFPETPWLVLLEVGPVNTDMLLWKHKGDKFPQDTQTICNSEATKSLKGNIILVAPLVPHNIQGTMASGPFIQSVILWDLC